MCGRPAGPYSLALPRATFDPILLRAAARAGAVVRESTRVQDLLWDGRAVAGVVARGGGDGKRETWRARVVVGARSEEHTSELQSQSNLVCRLLLEKKKTKPAS